MDETWIEDGTKPETRVIFKSPVSIAGQTEFEEMPFTVALLANFSGVRPLNDSGRTRRFIHARPGATNELMRRTMPRLRLAVPWDPEADSGNGCTLDLQFDSLEDFQPSGILARVLPPIPSADHVVKTVTEHDDVPSHIDNSQSTSAGAAQDVSPATQARIDGILHEPSFQKLHATWLGLDNLLRSCEGETKAKVMIFDTTRDELVPGRDGAGSLEPLIYALNELSTETYGGHPPSVLLVDFQFDPDHINILAALACIARDAGTVAVGAAGPVFLPGDSYERVNDIDNTNHFHSQLPRLHDWRGFRKSDLSQHMFLTLPPVLMRLPYERTAIQTDHDTLPLYYAEQVNPVDRSKYLWGTGVHALGSIIIASFRKFGWVADISPLETSGMTVNYPIHLTEDGPCLTWVGPTAVSVWHHTSSVISGMGFLPLIECKGSSAISVFEDHSCTKMEGAKAHLLYCLSLCRLRHSLAILVRHKGLAAVSDSELGAEIQQWLINYKAPSEHGGSHGDQRRWPIAAYNDIYIHSDSTQRRLEVELTLNFGNGRRSLVNIELTTATHKRALNLTDFKGSLEANIDFRDRTKAVGTL